MPTTRESCASCGNEVRKIAERCLLSEDCENKTNGGCATAETTHVPVYEMRVQMRAEGNVEGSGTIAAQMPLRVGSLVVSCSLEEMKYERWNRRW